MSQYTKSDSFPKAVGRTLAHECCRAHYNRARALGMAGSNSE